jgi:hypothetical protein
MLYIVTSDEEVKEVVHDWLAQHPKTSSCEEFMPQWNIKGGVETVMGTALKINVTVLYFWNILLYIIFPVLI